MGMVFFCFAFAFLFFANAAAVENQWLVGVNMAAAIYYTVVGAITGWIKARQ
jgi:hypothetical protein